MEGSRLAERPSPRIVRRYPAAPERLWRAWTDPQALKRWWGPHRAHSLRIRDLGCQRRNCRFRAAAFDYP